MDLNGLGTVAIAFVAGIILGRYFKRSKYLVGKKDGYKERMRFETFDKGPMKHEYKVDVASDAENELIAEMQPRRKSSSLSLVYVLIFLIFFIFFFILIYFI